MNYFLNEPQQELRPGWPLVRERLTGGFLCAVFCLSSVSYQFLCFLSVPGNRNEWNGMLLPGTAASQVIRWNMCMDFVQQTFSLQQNCLVTTLFLEIWTLWPLLIPCSLDNGCCTFGFLIFIIVERNSLYNSLYILTERSLKAPLLHQRLGSPCLSFFLSLFLSLPLANSLESGNPLSALSCLGFQDLLERMPCAFVSGASPVLGFYWFSA